MHLDTLAGGSTLAAMRRRRGRSAGDFVRAAILDIACRLENYQDWESGPAVTLPSLVEGRVSVALSVLYQPFDEMDVESGFQAAPQASYFDHLLAELERVDILLGTAESISSTVDSASRLAYLAFSNPVIKAIAFASGMAGATRRMRRRRAMEE